MLSDQACAPRKAGHFTPVLWYVGRGVLSPANLKAWPLDLPHLSQDLTIECNCEWCSWPAALSRSRSLIVAPPRGKKKMIFGLAFLNFRQQLGMIFRNGHLLLQPMLEKTSQKSHGDLKKTMKNTDPHGLQLHLHRLRLWTSFFVGFRGSQRLRVDVAPTAVNGKGSAEVCKGHQMSQLSPKTNSV